MIRLQKELHVAVVLRAEDVDGGLFRLFSRRRRRRRRRRLRGHRRGCPRRGGRGGVVRPSADRGKDGESEGKQEGSAPHEGSADASAVPQGNGADMLDPSAEHLRTDTGRNGTVCAVDPSTDRPRPPL